MFVDLVDVKINLEWEWVEATAPTVAEKEPTYVDGDRWLDTSTGFSYVLQDQAAGTWARTFKAQDNKFSLIAQNVEDNAFAYLSTIFPALRNEDYTGDLFGNFSREEKLFFLRTESVFSVWDIDSATKTLTVDSDSALYGDTSVFQAGDKIYLSTGRNKGFLTVVSTTATSVTVSETLIDETDREAFLTLAAVPDAIDGIIGAMIYYDIYIRAGSSPGLKSEKIGTYSYTKESFSVAGRKYPSEVAGELDQYAAIVAGGESFNVI